MNKRASGNKVRNEIVNELISELSCKGRVQK